MQLSERNNISTNPSVPAPPEGKAKSSIWERAIVYQRYEKFIKLIIPSAGTDNIHFRSFLETGRSLYYSSVVYSIIIFLILLSE